MLWRENCFWLSTQYGLLIPPWYYHLTRLRKHGRFCSALMTSLHSEQSMCQSVSILLTKLNLTLIIVVSPVWHLANTTWYMLIKCSSSRKEVNFSKIELSEIWCLVQMKWWRKSHVEFSVQTIYHYDLFCHMGPGMNNHTIWSQYGSVGSKTSSNSQFLLSWQDGDTIVLLPIVMVFFPHYSQSHISMKKTFIGAMLDEHCQHQQRRTSLIKFRKSKDRTARRQEHFTVLNVDKKISHLTHYWKTWFYCSKNWP